MSEAEQLDLEAEDQDRLSISAISRLSTSDDTETLEETATRTDQLEQIRKAVSLRNRLVKCISAKNCLYQYHGVLGMPRYVYIRELWVSSYSMSGHSKTLYLHIS